MINRLFRLLYSTVFVNIVVQKATTLVYVEESFRKKVLRSEQKEFDTIVLSEDMKLFIEDAIKESPYYYISFLDNSKGQGALPVCSKKDAIFYKNIEADELLCVDNTFATYSLRDDLYDIEKIYQEVGIDFIFSPFVILYNIFKDKINGDIALFILLEEKELSLSIFQNSKLLYAKYITIDMEEENLLLEEEMESLDELDEDFGEGDTLEELDNLDDLDSLDEIGEVEDLDSLDDLDSFDTSEDLEEELNSLETEEELASSETNTEKSIDSFKEDYQRYIEIESAINQFYADEKYESDFVEKVYIADSLGVSRDLKRYLEEELFLSVYIRTINITLEVCKIAKMELQK
ncbi:hypothetical protein MNB_SM-3-999 [hydrothermal vent metagenome]|uniref:Uncharacterized protein n=1 Tax=hydrothermal vent metagenome TaxID=652676 RepID=A0A1W1D4P4_9ZZZZ